MKNFIRKIYDNHAIKEVSLFIGGIITGAALGSQSGDERILSAQEKEDIFLKRNGDKEDVFIKRTEGDSPLDEEINHGSDGKKQP